MEDVNSLTNKWIFFYCIIIIIILGFGGRVEEERDKG